LIALGLVAWLWRTAPPPPAPSARAQPTGLIRPQDLADAVQAVIAADLEVYARVIQHFHERGAPKMSERWQEEMALPLPAQMVRLGGETVQAKGAEFAYVLRSLWPINAKNAPATDVERRGLQAVAEHPKDKFYAEETLGGRRYLTAIYAQEAISASCLSCHNQELHSPKKDFKVGDVIGGLVIRVALEF
jgi:hypothetical protein